MYMSLLYCTKLQLNSPHVGKLQLD